MDKIFSYFISPEPSRWLIILKGIFIFFTLFFLFIIILLLRKSSWLKIRFLYDLIEFFTYRPFGLKKINKSWDKIIKRLESGIEAEVKLAVIEADLLFDDTLKKMNIKGDTLEEKLGNLTDSTFSNIEELREAHKIRNNIVYDPDYKLTLEKGKRIISIYEKAFKELEIF